MVGQDSGQPWFLFWNTQSLELLAQPNLKMDHEMKSRCVDYLRQCHNPEEGGFRGAPHIMSHVASTYAAIMAIVNISTEEAYNLVDLAAMKKYLCTVKNNFK
jgi:protein farnesyltransferase subunit beta